MSDIFRNLSFPEADPHLLQLLKEAWEGGDPYVVWLQGEMGAGKTSLVRSFLYSLGLPAHTPVVSPTYTLMNEYKIGSRWYAHLDLYRADARFSMDELGVRDVRSYHGMFIEWPKQAGELELIEATHILSIEPESELSRLYSLKALSAPGK